MSTPRLSHSTVTWGSEYGDGGTDTASVTAFDDFEDEDDPGFVPVGLTDYSDFFRCVAGSPAGGRRYPYWRHSVLKRDHGICALCRLDTLEAGVPWEADHTIPLVEKGEDSLRNLRTLCKPCHKTVTAELTKRRFRRG